MATYVNDLRLKEIATGDESGTWGTSTNTNLELIADAFSYATKDCFATDADATETMADGVADEIRSLYLKVTSSATLTATRTLTLAPNTVSKTWIIENATTGGQSISISQGSGANVTIPNGDTKIIYTDGAGAAAAVTDAFANLKVTDPAQTNITSVGTLTGLTLSGEGLAYFALGTYSSSASNNAGLRIRSSTGAASGNWAGMTFQATSGDSTGTFWQQGITTGSGSYASDFVIKSSTGASSMAERIRITSGGNFGIGTTSPNYPLTVHRTGDGVKFEISDLVDANYRIQVSGNDIITGPSTGSDYIFQTSNAERMRIDTSGNVGIGTTSPSQKLTVSTTSASQAILISTSSANSDSVAISAFGKNISKIPPLPLVCISPSFSTSKTKS